MAEESSPRTQGCGLLASRLSAGKSCGQLARGHLDQLIIKDVTKVVKKKILSTCNLSMNMRTEISGSVVTLRMAQQT